MKTIMLFLSVLLLVCCTSNTPNIVGNQEDYNEFLVVKQPKTTSKYFELWNAKIRPDSIQLTSFLIVGGEYTRYFKETGDITYLKKAEQSLKKAVAIAAVGKETYLRALARNYIAQHRFKEALVLANEALEIGGGANESRSLLFDVHMELGNYKLAEAYLESIKNLSDFAYIIRLSKWNDYKGDLDTTITFMEKAKEKAISSQNKELMLWSFTNLADYYGHAGMIAKSYEHYLMALQLDGRNAYAKKGIAWILFSHDQNPKEALRILDSVTITHKTPDYYLLKAEIADYMGNDLTRLNNLDKYFMTVKHSGYGAMYNSYNVALFLEETEQFEKAIKLSLAEVANRPTPESYSWLGYSYLKNGEKEKAKEIMDLHVYGKTFEPTLCYHAALVYKANDELEKVRMLKQDLVDAIYELGPGMEQSIMAL